MSYFIKADLLFTKLEIESIKLILLNLHKLLELMPEFCRNVLFVSRVNILHSNICVF